MSEDFIEVTEDDFVSKFPLLRNHLNPDASMSLGGSEGCLFETYGAELDFVLRQDDRAVWTLVDAEGELFLMSGRRVVDRIGFVVSTVLIPQGAFAQVRLS